MGSQYEKRLNRAIDQMDSVNSLTFSNQAWLSIRLDIIGVVLALITALLVVTNRFNLNPSTAGLILTYMLQVIGMVQFMIKQYVRLSVSFLPTLDCFMSSEKFLPRASSPEALSVLPNLSRRSNADSMILKAR